MRLKYMFGIIFAIVILSNCAPKNEQIISPTLLSTSPAIELTQTITLSPTNTPTSTPVAKIVASNSAFCKYTSSKENTFLSTTQVHVPDGFNAEYFIAPSGLNTPSDIVVTNKNEIIVTSSRAQALQKINPDGSISILAKLYAYAIDQDSQGMIYAYNVPVGQVYSVSPSGGINQIAKMPATAHESPMAVAPDGTIYIGYNDGNEASLYIIPSGGGSPNKIIENAGEFIQSLDTSSDGTLYGVIDVFLYKIDPLTGKKDLVIEIPDYGSFHGLVAADDGTLYVATGEKNSLGKVYAITPDRKVKIFAEIPNEGFEGIAINSLGEITGVQRRNGGVLSIDSDGAIITIVKPNGLVSPQSLAISPCGELLTVNDEAGWATLTLPDGAIRPLVDMISYQPPQTFVAFSKDGWFVSGESAPGLPSLVNIYSQNGKSHKTLKRDIPSVSGVAIDRENNIYISGTKEGVIYKSSADGKKFESYIDGILFPQAIIPGLDNTLYAITGGELIRGTGTDVPAWGDKIISISYDGTVKNLSNITGAASLAIDSDGWLYAASNEGVVFRVSSSGRREQFATGLKSARGVAFDIEGNLYIADDVDNSIVRIRGFQKFTITGVIIDNSNQAGIAGAYLQIVNHNPPFAGRIIQVDPNGLFQIDVSPGIYDLRIWADGYLLAEKQLNVDGELENKTFILEQLGK